MLKGKKHIAILVLPELKPQTQQLETKLSVDSMHLTLDITPGLLAFSSEHKAPGPTTLRLRSVYSSTPGLRLKLQGPSAKNTKPPSGAHAFFPALLEIQLAHVRNPATYWSIFWSIGFFMNYGKLWQTMDVLLMHCCFFIATCHQNHQTNCHLKDLNMCGAKMAMIGLPSHLILMNLRPGRREDHRRLIFLPVPRISRIESLPLRHNEASHLHRQWAKPVASNQPGQWHSVIFSENIPMDAGTSMINSLIFFFPGAPRKTGSSSHVEMLI